ncbi:CBS domain-containing protein [Nonomuraea sp. NPDC001831]|uniref:CBS domain-containing protein n=1 Tax=Nonomuraea sp. NPDC001831 TaxID=3364340 RepID=UPI0036CD90B9
MGTRLHPAPLPPSKERAGSSGRTPSKEIAKARIEHQVDAMLVVDDDRRVVGVVSEADLLPREDFRELRRSHRVRPDRFAHHPPRPATLDLRLPETDI